MCTHCVLQTALHDSQTGVKSFSLWYKALQFPNIYSSILAQNPFLLWVSCHTLSLFIAIILQLPITLMHFWNITTLVFASFIQDLTQGAVASPLTCWNPTCFCVTTICLHSISLIPTLLIPIISQRLLAVFAFTKNT